VLASSWVYLKSLVLDLKIINKFLMSRFFSPFITVKQNHRAIIERLGKFSRVVEPGLAFKLPMIDLVAYEHSLKEEVLDIEHQTAITKDNVKI
jgi:regulator of protease activity HflC (stomatin/prohibitin superfamily)